MSKLWSTSLRDTLSNRRNSSMPKLQCRGYRAEDLYVTSPNTSATTDKIPGKKTLRDYRDFDRPLSGRAGQDQETIEDLHRFLGAFPEGSREWTQILEAIKNTLGGAIQPAALREAIHIFFRVPT